MSTDTVVPMLEGETMHAALTKAGVPASFMRIEKRGDASELASQWQNAYVER